MRKFFGTVLILGGVLSLADFLIWGTIRIADPQSPAYIANSQSHLLLPFLAAGQDYPTAVQKLCFGLGMLAFGLYLLLLEGDMNRCPLSLIFMINALLLCFSLLVAFTAGQPLKAGSDALVSPDMVGIAAAAAVLFVVCGLLLLYFAATERPVGKAALSIGSVVYVASAAVAAVVYLNGKAA